MLNNIIVPGTDKNEYNFYLACGCHCSVIRFSFDDYYSDLFDSSILISHYGYENRKLKTSQEITAFTKDHLIALIECLKIGANYRYTEPIDVKPSRPYKSSTIEFIFVEGKELLIEFSVNTKKNKKIHGWDIFITKSQVNELISQLENMLKCMIDKGY